MVEDITAGIEGQSRHIDIADSVGGIGRRRRELREGGDTPVLELYIHRVPPVSTLRIGVVGQAPVATMPFERSDRLIDRLLSAHCCLRELIEVAGAGA